MECQRGLATGKLSVRLSVKRVDCDKTKEKSVQIFILYERSFSLVFGEEEWLVGGDPFYLKFCVKLNRWSEINNFQLIFARSTSVVAPSEKCSINSNKKKAC